MRVEARPRAARTEHRVATDARNAEVVRLVAAIASTLDADVAVMAAGWRTACPSCGSDTLTVLESGDFTCSHPRCGATGGIQDLRGWRGLLPRWFP